ncbi:MAG: hypothetical protein ACRCSN_11960, partial [Dermatophilaceae bacterium]
MTSDGQDRTTGEVVEVRLSGGGRRPGLVIGCFLGLGSAALCWPLTRIAIDGGQPTWAVMFGALAAVLLTLLAGFVVAAVPRRRGRLRLRHHDEGLEVVGSCWSALAETLAAVVLLGGVALGTAAMMNSGTVDVTAIGPLVVLAGFAAACLWPAARNGSIVRPADSLRLDRQGFTTRTHGRLRRFAWGDVTGFVVTLGGLGSQVLGPGGTRAPSPVVELRSDAALVVRLLEFYRTHERERAELSSGAALDRLR